MNITSLVVGSALVLSGAACSKKEDKPNPGFTPAGSGSGSAGKPVEGKDDAAAPSELAAWMPKGANLAWEQNAWTSRLQLRTSGTMSMAGDPVALEIKGDKAKAWDGKTEHQLGFKIDSPCTVAFTKEITEGGMQGTQTMRKNYAMVEGKFLVGDGDVGYRKGKTAFVCGHGDHDYVIADDKGTCTSFRLKFREWEKQPVKCEWTQVDGKEALKIGEGQFPIVVKADGDLLLSDQFDEFAKKGYHTAAKSFDEAKEAVNRMVKENDPVEIAKAAGGKVGETNTVASLMATFGTDRKSVEGKEVEVTALYLNSNQSTSNGKTTHNAILVDKQGDMKLTLTCNLDAEVKGLKQYDKVKAKGTVGESFDKAALDKCTLTKAK